MAKLSNIEELIEQIRTFLPQYLESRGIEVSLNKSFRCFNPDHEDKSPSMNLIDDEVFYCHSCHLKGNIFHAHALLENAPIRGKAFLLHNLAKLASKFDISFSLEDLTEEEIYEFDTYRAYRVAADLINYGFASPQVKDYIKKRGWTKEDADKYQFGGVRDFSTFRNHLKKLGLSATFLDEVDLSRRDLFNEDSLIFTICDEIGRPVGFSARNINFEKNSEGHPSFPKKKSKSKYTNSTTGLKCNIYQKGKRLYNLHNALKTKAPFYYLFEGYSDVITAASHGIENCLAVGGTAFTRDHLFTLQSAGIDNLTVAFDGDRPGIEKAKDILDKHLSSSGIRLSILILENEDPDSFISKLGGQTFSSLKRMSAFEWRLLSYPENTDPFEISQKMIPFILGETSFLRQETMCKQLAQQTGFTLQAVVEELDRFRYENNRVKDKERSRILNKLNYDLSKEPFRAECILSSTITDLQDVEKKYDKSSVSEESFISLIEKVRTREELDDGSFPGYRLSPDLIDLQNSLCGKWEESLIFIGGKENCGKSALSCNIALDLIENNKDTMVIFHSTDDSAELALRRFVALASRKTLLPLSLNQVSFPNYWATKSPAIIEIRNKAYLHITSLAKEGRLVIKDATDGNTISYGESIISYYQKKYPSRKIVYMVDNFHNMMDFANSDNERVRFKRMSAQIKSLAVKRKIPIICTVEYTKIPPGARPSNNNISESVALLYQANYIVHLYNEFHEFQEEAAIYHVGVNSMGQAEKMPKLECIVGKNKICDFKGKFYLDFFPANSSFGRSTSVLPPEEQNFEEDFTSLYSIS